MNRRRFLSLLAPAALCACRAVKMDLPVLRRTDAAGLGRLAFVTDGDLWVQDVPDGTPQSLVVGLNARAPRWSRSGRYLAFLAGKLELGESTPWVADLVTGSLRQLPDATRLGPERVVWSPAHDQLAYSSSSGALVVEAMDDGGRQIVAQANADPGSHPGAVAWSPDGQWLAYDRTDRLTANGQRIPSRISSVWRARPDGGDALELVNSGAPEAQRLLARTWTPDSGYVLYQTDPSYSSSILADGTSLFAVPASGGEPAKLIQSVLNFPDFVVPEPPGGSSIAVIDGGFREAWTNKRLLVVHPATGAAIALSDPGVAASSPAWSPDGRTIAYVAGPDAGNVGGGPDARRALAARRIMLVDVPKPPTARPLVDDPDYRDEAPRWSADGTSILFARIDTADEISLWLTERDGGSPRRLVTGLGTRDPQVPSWFGFYGHIDWGSMFDWWPGA